MLLSAVSVLVVAQSSSEIPEGRMNNPVFVSMHTNGGHAPLCLYPLHMITSVNVFMRRKKEML